MSKKSLDELIGQALDNIENDRQVTEEMLTDIKCYLKGNDSRYAEVGNTAAKFVETLQRSNEQIVKLAALVHKKETVNGSTALSDDDKDNLFDLIKKVD
jgi:hypothetical protein